MVHIRKLHVVAVGFLTPTLMGQSQTSDAADAAPAIHLFTERKSAASLQFAKKLLQREVFTLSPAEKLKLSGASIRLSAEQTGSSWSLQVLSKKKRKR